jgi:hypothetical protein
VPAFFLDPHCSGSARACAQSLVANTPAHIRHGKPDVASAFHPAIRQRATAWRALSARRPKRDNWCVRSGGRMRRARRFPVQIAPGPWQMWRYVRQNSTECWRQRRPVVPPRIVTHEPSASCQVRARLRRRGRPTQGAGVRSMHSARRPAPGKKRSTLRTPRWRHGPDPARPH